MRRAWVKRILDQEVVPEAVMRANTNSMMRTILKVDGLEDYIMYPPSDPLSSQPMSLLMFWQQRNLLGVLGCSFRGQELRHQRVPGS